MSNMPVVKIDSEFSNTGNLKYQTSAGVPVENANIRIWFKSDFDTGLTDRPLALTKTDVDGKWVDPVFLETGYTYVVQFQKPGSFGPDNVEIIV
jgi:hypothetical protein